MDSDKNGTSKKIAPFRRRYKSLNFRADVHDMMRELTDVVSKKRGFRVTTTTVVTEAVAAYLREFKQ